MTDCGWLSYAKVWQTLCLEKTPVKRLAHSPTREIPERLLIL